MESICKFKACEGLMVCGSCQSLECDCDIMYYHCNTCCHKICNWCGHSNLNNHESTDCIECCDWNHYGDVCEADFCVNYLGGHGNIMENLICNECESKLPIIRVPLAFPLSFEQVLKDYPNFVNIKGSFLKYYGYSHTSGIWEPYPQSEFRLAQEYFDFDGGIIVLGRSRDEENKAKYKELKVEKQARKALKKERRLMRLKDEKMDKILAIS